MYITKENSLKVLKTIIYLVPVIIVAWLISNHFALFGKVKSSYGFGNKPSLISDLTPKTRVNDPVQNLVNSNVHQEIINAPVYFDIHTTRNFKTTSIEIEYQAKDQPIIELGVKKSPDDIGFEYQTFQNIHLDNLKEGWNVTKDVEKDLILLQHGTLDTASDKYNYKYSNVSDFLNDFPTESSIAYYKYNIHPHLKINNYKSSDTIKTFNNYLRGKHKIITYIKDEALNYTFSYYDINRYAGPDRFNINVYYGGKKVFIDSIADDGDETPSGVNSGLKTYSLNLPDLPEGVYEVEIEISDDFIIEQIKTTQKYNVFANNVFLADNNEYKSSIKDIKQIPTTLYAISNEFKLKTFHPTGDQIISMNNDKIKLNYLNEDYTKATAGNSINFDNDIRRENFTNIVSPINNISIKGKYFVFDETDYFDPEFNTYNLKNLKSIDLIDYILVAGSDYKSPSKSGSWNSKSLTFDISNAYVEDENIKFILSMPNHGNIEQNEIKIKNINVILEKDPIWINFFGRLRSFLKK